MVSSSVVLFVLRLKVESSICHAHDIKVFRRGYLKEILHEMMMQDFSSGDNVADFLFGFKNMQLLTGNEMLRLTSLSVRQVTRYRFV